jgi:hypothetical protein
LVDAKVVVLLIGPAPLDAAVVLSVVEAGNSVEQTRVDDTTRDRSEFSRSVLPSGHLALVPQTPLSAWVPGKVATLCTHEDIVMDVIVLVGKREEVGDLEVEAVCTSLDQGTQCLVRLRLPKSAKECPVCQIRLRSRVEGDSTSSVLTLDSRAEHHVPMGLSLPKDCVHLRPRLHKWISPSSNVPALRVF